MGLSVNGVPPQTQLDFKCLRRLPRSTVRKVLQELRTLERKSFASNEAFDFDEKLLTQRNSEIFVGQTHDREVTMQNVVAYAVVVKWNRRLLLHKICVSRGYRGQGIGRQLMEILIDHAKFWSCRGIDLWVDEANEHARSLYRKHDFLEHQHLQNYYSTGRNGIKMVLDLSP